MNRDSIIREQGFIGEQIVRICLELNGHTVVMSEDRFDQDKDMTIDNETAEIKTFGRWFKYNSFALEKSDWRKWDNANRRFFVEVPYKNRDDAIHVWECIDHKKYETIDSIQDKRMYNVDHLHLYDTVVNLQLSNRLFDLSPSKWKGKL